MARSRYRGRDEDPPDLMLDALLAARQDGNGT